MLAREITQHVEHALQGLAYGSIQLIVHDSRVVRIERIERIKLTEPSEASSTTIRPTDPLRGGLP